MPAQPTSASSGRKRKRSSRAYTSSEDDINDKDKRVVITVQGENNEEDEEEDVDQLAGDMQSQSSEPNLSLPIGGLNRGFACMGCRKRKSRCDTQRPSCEQCIRAKMPCVYDDRPPKRPTDLLKEKIRELEDKVKQLERLNPGLIAATAGSSSASPRASGSGLHPSPTGSQHSGLHLPITQGQWQQHEPSTSPHSHSGSPGFATDQRLPHSNVRAGSEPSNIYSAQPQRSNPPPGILSRGSIEANFSQIAPDTSNDPLPAGLDQNELIRIFLHHRHQAYFNVSVPRFWQSLQPTTNPSSVDHILISTNSNNAHPSILNAVYLLACFFSGRNDLASYEPLFLQRARQAIANSLEHAVGLLPSIQAASLVSMYLHARGRVLEGYYLSCSNARFAIGCGLHQIESPVWDVGGQTGPEGPGGVPPTAGMTPLLGPARDPTELGERIHIWWQVWMVDQCAAISTNLPPAISDTFDPSARIDTCFPPEMSEFENGSFQAPGLTPADVGFQVGNLRSLYNRQIAHQAYDGRRSALVIKATELLSRAWKLSKHDVKDESFREEFDNTDTAIRRLSTHLPHIPNDQGLYLAAFVLPHSFTLGAIIQLHWIVAVEHDHLHPSYQNCLNAAIDMVNIIDGLTETDYTLLEMHIGTCWKLTADVLYREMLRVQRNNEMEEATDYNEALGKVQEATQKLARIFPVLMELWRLSPRG